MMNHETNISHRNRTEYEPLDDPEVLATDREDVFVVETKFDDPEILDVIDRNRDEINRGAIAVDAISELRPRTDGYAFKVMRGDVEENHIAGIVYGITKGRDTRTMELAYAKDDVEANQDIDSRGVMSSGVRAVADRFKKSHDLMFDIADTNEPSIRIARKIGAKVLDTDGRYSKYFTERQR